MATVVANIEQAPVEEINRNRVTLVVPSNCDATRLREFKEKVKQTFAARIIEIIGSREETIITFEVDRMINVANMCGELANMPEVEKAEETDMRNHQSGHKGISVTLATQ